VDFADSTNSVFGIGNFVICNAELFYF